MRYTLGLCKEPQCVHEVKLRNAQASLDMAMYYLQAMMYISNTVATEVIYDEHDNPIPFSAIEQFIQEKEND